MSSVDDKEQLSQTKPDSGAGLLIGGVALALIFLGIKSLFSDSKPEPEARHSARFWRDLEFDAEEVYRQ